MDARCQYLLFFFFFAILGMKILSLLSSNKEMKYLLLLYFSSLDCFIQSYFL